MGTGRGGAPPAKAGVYFMGDPRGVYFMGDPPPLVTGDPTPPSRGIKNDEFLDVRHP